MEIEIKIQRATYNKLHEYSQPFETLDQVLERVLKAIKKPKTRARGGRKIGRVIRGLIRQQYTNDEIFSQVVSEFPGTRIKTPKAIASYRSQMKKEARDKRNAKRKK